MNSETILKSDLLDILFDKRNKSYGAYILRKFYPDRIKTSLFIMFGIVTLFSAFTFLPDKKIIQDRYKTEDVVLKQQILAKEEVAKPEPKTASTPRRSQVKSSSNFEIVPDKDSTEIFQEISKLATENKTAIFEEGDDEAGPGSTGNGLEELPVQTAAEPAAPNNTPIDKPDFQASFPGGAKELIRFLQKNLRSPRDMEEEELVEVKIKCVVDFDGNLQSFNVVQDGGEEFNSEVIRVLKKMPKWNPGKKGGQNVPVYYTIPVKFVSN